ncbi:hypothetical protein CXB51_030328 [Gossypium anomalum]|uniref:Thioesterase domain-containing protein n=1 Tax=Gossypium anomalum TaxID=47600 RepID=A0A8J5YWN6_9ROSI|nr:hypothetical protein CXB51_030328 [Gossypium anomalum]
MDLETVKKYLEKGVGADGDDKNASTINGMPSRFFENFIMQGLHVDQIEKGRVLCSMKVPPRLLNAGNFLHGGATASLVDLVGSAVIYTYGVSTSGVSVEISITYLDAAYVGVKKEETDPSIIFWDLFNPSLVFMLTTIFLSDQRLLSSGKDFGILKVSVLSLLNIESTSLGSTCCFRIPGSYLQCLIWNAEKYQESEALVVEEIEIEAKALRVGKTVAVVTVEFRKKKTGKIIAQGRHTKYLTVQSKILTSGI